MIGYPKIETLYNRNPENMKQVIVGELRDPSFGLVDRWLVTEKIDGTNIRIGLEPVVSSGGWDRVEYGGRTDDAQTPPFLLKMLQERFPADVVSAAFDPDTRAVIFGEGYGPKIQKGGGDYADEVGFIVFDVAVINPTGRLWWLNWPDVCDVAEKIGAPTVPVLGLMSTVEAVEAARGSSVTAVREREREGIVARTDPLLMMRNGERLVWKMKGRDL